MKNKITRVCIVNTVYTLFIYLLYSTKDELDETFYFFSNGIAQSIYEKFPNHYFIAEKLSWHHFWNVFRRILLLGIIGHFRWPFLRNAKIFGQDHLPFSPFIIKKRDYTFIEDAPHALSICWNTQFYSGFYNLWGNNRFSFKKMAYRFISGTYKRPMANNKQCKGLILTTDEEVPYISEKLKHIIPLEDAWNKTTDRKKEYIKDVYGLFENDVAALQGKTHIIFTQPFSTEKIISEIDQIEIYKQIVAQYDRSILVIKSHPRDMVDYRKYFPEIYIFNKVIPMELLLLMGCINFKKVITISSAAIYLFPDTVEKEWIGSSIHPVLYKMFPKLVNSPYH